MRVVITTREDGTGKLVYVANMNEVTPTGAYRVKTMTRSAWDELGAGKRKARLEALAPSAQPAPSDSAPNAGPNFRRATEGARQRDQRHHLWRFLVQAVSRHRTRYLKQRGVTVIDKDIEENEVAAAEMRQKLARGWASGSTSRSSI